MTSVPGDPLVGDMVIIAEEIGAAYAVIRYDETNIVSNDRIRIPLMQRANTPLLLGTFFRHTAPSDFLVTVLTLKELAV